MNFVFWLLIILALVAVWATSTGVWSDIGNIFTEIFNEIKEKEEEE